MARALWCLACLPLSFAFLVKRTRTDRNERPYVSGFDRAGLSATIDYQFDYGRGADHLTADLQEGNVVVYQIGTWYVDGVAVGDGSPPEYKLCLVDTIQIVWSHNCEHGVVRGFPIIALEGDLLRVQGYDEIIAFGPEQLVARIPVQPTGDADTVRSLVHLSDELWKQETN
jgi:hypothetical protein